MVAGTNLNEIKTNESQPIMKPIDLDRRTNRSIEDLQ